MLANERTFAGWLRTGYAAAAIGLGFHGLFGEMHPWWLPRAVASLFLLLAIAIFISAEGHAAIVIRRLNAHEVKPLGHTRLRWLTIASSAGVIAFLLAMWLLPYDPRDTML